MLAQSGMSRSRGSTASCVAAALCVIVIVSCVGAPAAAQARPCAEPAARDFDFWIGDWQIDQSILRQDGTWLELPARTTVAATLDGCALIERWEGQVMFFWEGMNEPEKLSGLSVRAYDPTTGQWYIHWMDTRAPRFDQPYVGRFVNGQGVFFRKWETPAGNRVGRVTFDDITADSVSWALAVSSDDGQTWQTIWTMRMSRVERVPAVR